MSAAMMRSEHLIILLLANGAALDAHALTHQTALRVAAIHGHDSCVRLLIEEVASLDPVEDPILYTTSMFACTQCATETVEFLIKQGAYVNVMALDRMTPLRCAAAAGRPELSHLLQQYGASV